MASSGGEQREGKAPAVRSKEEEPPMVGKKKDDPKKKKKMIRLSQEQIDECIAWDEEERRAPSLAPEPPKVTEALAPERLARLSPHILQDLIRMDAEREGRIARRAALQEALRKEREEILEQYYTKGYVELEAADEEGTPEPRRVLAGEGFAPALSGRHEQ
ncbi:hypothetical protein ACP70R_002797 [Stipagrostis hirtigluma subsp. patula]